MKHIQIKTLILAALMIGFMGACTKILDETPRAIFTPEYFKTDNGVIGGLNYMYFQLRYLQPNGYYYESCQAGTDESTYGQNVNADSKNLDFSGIGVITPDNSTASTLWNVAFPTINTASGIIENGSASSTITTAMICEARFFRAWEYFMLVQTFGGVPLDLGAGELKFNTSTSRSSVRNTVPEVYTKAIFPDLLLAVANLPSKGRLTGCATNTLASLYLAKAYLTYGWWLENPNSIPTYPASDRTDPDGHNAAWYFQQAYTVATTAIANPGSFALQKYFYDVNVGTKDYNNEVMMIADHTQSSELYNGQSLTYSTGASLDYFANWMTTWNYTNLKCSSSNTAWANITACTRIVLQGYGRPWCGVAPPIEVVTNTFADKTNDSRYDGTFQTTYRSNWVQAGIKVNNVVPATLYNANFLPIVNGDPILTFLGDETQTPGIVYPAFHDLGQSGVAAGVLPARADFVIAPSGISRLTYPGLWKIGPYRTDNGVGVGQQNAGNTRPFPIAKFSELFLIASEAAVKGATTAPVTGTYANDGTAYELINILRARAGQWYWSNNGNAALVADHSADMVAATPLVIDINYVLAERSRELYGEAHRWFDLVRTQKWAEIAGTYTICNNPASSLGDHVQTVVTRTIAAKDYLRPIPRGTINSLTALSAADLAAYQNPGYN